MPERRIYLLSPRELSPETIAVTFAKTSRSPESFDEIASGLNEEKSAKFHEKWVVGYGHASVAEHAVLHVAFENVSRLAIECIESNRLASYTEKSTRYQKWSAENFYVPSELDGNPLRDDYIAACQLLFKTYGEALEPVRKLVMARTPRRDGESDEALDRRIRSQYVDACRFLLPASSLANVGMTVNARVLENSIRKMLSHELAEVRAIGLQVKNAALAEVPTLVKYADAVPYISETRAAMQDLARFAGSANLGEAASAHGCRLVAYDPEAEEKVLAAALYRFGSGTFEEASASVHSMPAAERELLAASLLGRLGEHDAPLRELEYSDYVFDLVMDQGAYAEFKRHRMMTQSPQRLTTRLGYSVPRLIAGAELLSTFEVVMKRAAGVYEELEKIDPYVAQYVVPNGFHRRVLAKFNLREAFAFCQLRSAPNAHFSIRRVAEQISAELLRVHPILSKYMRLPDETWQDVEASHFA